MRRRKLTRPEWADKLEGLRQHLGLSQAALAKRLNVSAMAPSRWERGLHEPPAAVLLALGKLAGNPGCWYFWERAGLTRRDLKAVLERPSLRRNSHKTVTVEVPRGKPDGKSTDLLAVPVYATSIPVGEVGPSEVLLESLTQLVVVPRDWCSHPEDIYCLRAGTNRMAPMMRKETIFAVDPRESDPEELIGKIVFASHPDCGLSVNWLQRFGHSLVLIPDNKDEEPYYVENDDWKIKGRVLWWFSKGP